MRRTLWRSIAAGSVLICALSAARRPRYGGEFRIEIEAIADPASLPDPFTGQIFERLIRVDERGEFRPCLAASWSHDAGRKRWIFAPRPSVLLHDGSAWQAAPVEISDDAPLPNILRDLIRTGPTAATGPFRVASFDAGRSLRLEAHAAHWRGRPYLDAVELRMGRALREQAIDFDAGKADAIEIAVTDIRRFRQRGTIVSISQPLETVVLRFESERASAAVREAIALSIDRAAIHTVLLQRQGEAAAALLPRWLSGYAFLFSIERNVARAKQLGGQAPQLTYGYDPQDSMLRAIAERIAVNASETGIALRPAGTGAPDLRVVRVQLASRDALLALAGIAVQLRLASPKTATAYETERGLLDGYRVIPIAHLPHAWALSPKVKDWGPLENVWLDPAERTP